jgi:peptidoglycan hydrolase-like protein with peptidoglycan-binding domain
MRATLPVALLASLALAAAAAAGTPGSADVAALQVGLAGKALYGADVDGFAGPATITALKKLPGAAGPLDAATRAALGTFGTTQLGDRPLLAGCRGWDVAELQFLLAWHGFPSGHFDGVFGDRTTAALMRFQRWAGIDAIGVAGPATRAALDEPPPVSPIRLWRPIDALPGDGFGPRADKFHPGVDYPAPLGTLVVAAGDGVVVSAGPVDGYGNLVVVQHSAGVTSMYAHLSKFLVEPGQSTGPHLHFEVRVRDAAVDPATALYQ